MKTLRGTFRDWPMGGGGGAVYDPGMMLFDGSTGYYGKTSVVAPTPNFVTCVFRFNVGPQAAGTSQLLINAEGNGPSKWAFLHIAVGDSDNANPDVRNKLFVFTKQFDGTILSRLVSNVTVTDNTNYVGFYAYNGDTAATIFRLNGLDVDDTGSAFRTTPITGSPNDGTGEISVGSENATAAVKLFNGEIGYLGYRHAYLTNWSDFMDGSNPKELDEVTWTEWGAQPEFWNTFGTMTDNKGSGGNMTKNGTITGPA